MPGTVKNENDARSGLFRRVGETLVNEERYWHSVAAAAQLRLACRSRSAGGNDRGGEDHLALWSHLGVEKPERLRDITYVEADLYPDALPCLDALRGLGFRVGLAGNQSEALERWTRAALPASMFGSSASWGARKPDPAFFERMLAEARCEPSALAYVGDRVDNDVVPALDAGLVAVQLRRGPWGRIQHAPREAVIIDSLSELPEALASHA